MDTNLNETYHVSKLSWLTVIEYVGRNRGRDFVFAVCRCGQRSTMNWKRRRLKWTNEMLVDRYIKPYFENLE